MKIIKNLLFATAAIAMGSALIACEDEPDKYEVASGTPTLYYVRPASAASADSLLTSASTGQIICLVGDNLRSIYELYFNDKQAILNSSYMTDHTAIVAIPSSIPDLVSNKIFMVTQAKDTVTFDFEVTVPAPTLSSMSCEYAPAGSLVTITGNYFVDDPNVPMYVTFPGDVVVEDFKTITETAISFIMPEVETEGTVDVTTIYGTTTSAFHYLDSRGIMFDFDGLTGLTNRGWHDATITSDETSICGNYVQLGDGSSTMDDNTWNDSKFSFEYWPGEWTSPVTYPAGSGDRLFDIVDFSDYTNMSLKFELYVPSSSSWSAGALQIIFAGTEYVSYGNADVDVYGNTVAGCNNAYISGDEVPRALYRPWTDSGSYNTGDEWVTVTLPLSSSFIYGYSGATATGSINETSFASLVLFLCGGGVSGTECTPLLKIDNIRAVPNN